MALSDFVSLNLGFVSAIYVVSYFNLMPSALQSLSTDFPLWITCNLIAITVALQFKNYHSESIQNMESIYRSSWRSVLAHHVVFLMYVYGIHRFEGMWWFLAVFFMISASYFAFSRLLLTYMYTVFPVRYNRLIKRVAIIGDDSHIPLVLEGFGKMSPFYQLEHRTISSSQASQEKKIKMFKRYFEEVSKDGIHDVFIAASPDIYSYSEELILAADHQCVQLNFIPVMTANITYSEKKASLSLALPVLKSHEEPMSTIENRLKKRMIDLVISSLVIVFILSWMIPIIGLIIKIQSPGPIFFKQFRSGRNNKPFYCYKFRSMVVNKGSDKDQASKGDKRITPIGQFLRKSSLDEFPQFINVFLGQMSIVGPRPHMLSHTEHYSELIQHYMVRHFVKPGITGWAQVNGFRGETKDPELMARRVEHDIEYMSNWSAMLDFKIIFMTAFNVFKGEDNAY